MMQSCVRDLIRSDPNTALILIDIGVYPFRDLLSEYPERVKNVGIFEPGTVGLAAGLSLAGITPTVYGITPFIVERAYEQLKLDFVYQKLGGNFITTGASYDFSTLGYSHYCPEDVSLLFQLPGMEILTPATPKQFETLWAACSENGRPSYFRLTDHACTSDVPVSYGKATVLKEGTSATVVCVAETLDKTLSACRDLDVTILYYATLQPFDYDALAASGNGKLIVCEPFYEGTTAQILLPALAGRSVSLESVGIPREVIRNYGTKEEKDAYYGLTENAIREKIVASIRRKVQ